MNTSEIPKPPKKNLIIAFGIALIADLMQVIFPLLFSEGFMSPFEDVLDVGVAGALSALLGWHWVFLPSFAFKLAPIVDVAPFWTLAVFYVWIGKAKRADTAHDAPTIIEHKPR